MKDWLRFGWGCLVLAACGPAVETDGGNGESGSAEAGSIDTGGTETASGSSATDSSAGSVSATTGPGACPDGTAYFEPPACPGGMPGTVELPIAGCYEVCDGPNAPCTQGGCVSTEINPCPCNENDEACCGACVANQWLCSSGDPLQPGFEEQLIHQDGCGHSNVFVYAADETSDLGMSLYENVGLLEMANDSGVAVEIQYTLPDPAVTLSVIMGPSAASNYCNDAPFGQVLRRYTATAGTIELEVQPSNDGGMLNQGIVTATLSAIVFEPDDGNGDPVPLPSYVFDAVEVWCCPG